MELKLKKGPSDLEADVLAQGLCCSCGACVGLCPYFAVMQEHVVLVEACGLLEGRCYDTCPRTVVDVEDLNQRVFGEARTDYVLGTHRGIFMSQASGAEQRERGQYGGTVTALLIHGLQSGAIDGALVAGRSNRYGLMPEAMVARTPEQVLQASGSKYSACPSLELLDKGMRECAKLAVVGRPCQVIALRKRIACEPEVGNRIALVIGLFCMWALDYKKMARHLRESIALEQARRVDIPFNRFVVTTDEGERELPFEPIRSLRRATCDLCFDFAAELADVAVGSTEWKDDWNTLICRTDVGETAVRRAQRGGALRLQPLPEERVALLRKASKDKKRRVLGLLSSPDGPGSGYLVISEGERHSILGT